ncbi:MAG TPA: hypothetical protein VF070_08300 [Streptosporangiaceae bacterium]
MANPASTAVRAIAELRIRSDHIPPHQARSSGVAKHHVDDVAVTSANPACLAQLSSRRPASGSPPLCRATRRYNASHSSSTGNSGYQVKAP